MSLGPASFSRVGYSGCGSAPRCEWHRAGPEDAPGRRYLRGALIGVALSIVPLVVVLVVSDGMIQGITSRYIEVGTYHLQAEPSVVMDRQGSRKPPLLLEPRPE